MPQTAADTNGLTLPDVEQELKRGSIAMRFGRKVEDAFDAQERLISNRTLIIGGLMGVVLYPTILIFDWNLLPDVFALSCLLRLAVFMPLMLVSVSIMAFSKSTALRQSSHALLAVFAALIVVVLILKSRSPYRVSYHYYLLLVLFQVLMQRLRFGYSVIVVTAILVAQAIVLEWSDAFDVHLIVADVVFFSIGSICLLVRIHSAERESRLSFLLGVQAHFLHEEVERSARIDPLTGLWNRRRLTERMEIEWRGASERSNAAVVILDIDHFKEFNDSHGHLEGDVCLERIGRCLTLVLRGSTGDVVRFGGEEFVLFLPDFSLASALRIAEEAVRNIRALAIPHGAVGPGAVVTVSAGVSVGRMNAISPDQLLRAADFALYDAKANGRDCVRHGPAPASVRCWSGLTSSSDDRNEILFVAG